MKTYFKFLSKNKFYTFVTVFGFAFSIMFVLLITVYIKQELSVDDFHEKGDRIYLLATNDQFGLRYSYADIVKDVIPEAEQTIPMSFSDYSLVKINNERLNITTSIVGDNFFSIFSFPLIIGNKDYVLESPGNAIISESFARKVFGDKDPIGETIIYDNSVTVTVSGVIADIKNSVIPYTDVILPYENLRKFQPNMDNSSGTAIVGVLATQGVDLREKNQDITNYFKEREEWDYENIIDGKAQFIPLQDVYFSELYAWQLNKGDKSFVLILMAVSIVILIFAIFNYINLTVAQTGFRAREMATRSLLGAKINESFIRLIFESVILLIFSLAFGVFLAFTCVSYVNNLLNTQLDLIEFFSFLNIVGMLLIVIFLGIISGIFPAYMISKFKPIDVVKGNFKLENKMVFSKVFIIIQNVLTIVLITASIVISKQIDHLISAPIGYNTKNIILMSIQEPETNISNGLINELEQLSSVKRVGLAARVPLTDIGYSTFDYNEKVFSYSGFEGDSVFFNMLGFQVLQENNLGYDHVNYFTEDAYKVLEMKDDETVMPNLGWHVGGKIKNVRLGAGINQREREIVVIAVKDRSYFQSTNSNQFKYKRLLVEIQGDPTIAYNKVKEVYENITKLEFPGKYMDYIIEEYFFDQKRLLKIINHFAGIALLISMLGLLAISNYFIRQRVKEVAIKKLIGSTSEKIIINLIRSFLLYVVAAFIIAVPIAYYFMNGWLNDYSYRISITPFYFILAGLFCLIISFLTVFYQSYRAAIANPADTLKSE